MRALSEAKRIADETDMRLALETAPAVTVSFFSTEKRCVSQPLP